MLVIALWENADARDFVNLSPTWPQPLTSRASAL